MKTRCLIFLTLIALIAFSCNKPHKVNEVDYGKTENGKYTNPFFNFELTLPMNWHVLSNPENNRLMNKSNELLSADNKAKNTNIEETELKTALLLTATKYEIGENNDFNPSLVIVAENLKGNHNIRKANDYLLLTRKTLEQENVKREYPEKTFQEKNINETDFSVMKVITEDKRMAFSQNYYVRIVNDFALTLIITYTTDEQRLMLEQSINTLKFN